MTCILVSGSGSIGGVEVDDMRVGSEDIVEGVSLHVSCCDPQIWGGWMTYKDDISVVLISMVELIVDSVALLLDRAMGELKA